MLIHTESGSLRPLELSVTGLEVDEIAMIWARTPGLAFGEMGRQSQHRLLKTNQRTL